MTPPLVIDPPLGFEPGFHSEFLMLGEKVETAGGARSMTPARWRSMVNDPCAGGAWSMTPARWRSMVNDPCGSMTFAEMTQNRARLRRKIDHDTMVNDFCRSGSKPGAYGAKSVTKGGPMVAFFRSGSKSGAPAAQILP